MRELRLGLEGRRLLFPDGKPVCLVCGDEPAGTRRVYFEEVAGASLVAGVRAIAGRVEFDAPLCRAHRARARRTSLGAILCILAAVGLVVLGAILVGPTKGRKAKSFLAEWGPILLGLIPGVPGFYLWRKRDRAGLSCEVRRDGESGLVLTYPA